MGSENKPCSRGTAGGSAGRRQGATNTQGRLSLQDAAQISEFRQSRALLALGNLKERAHTFHTEPQELSSSFLPLPHAASITTSLSCRRKDFPAPELQCQPCQQLRGCRTPPCSCSITTHRLPVPWSPLPCWLHRHLHPPHPWAGKGAPEPQGKGDC